MIRYTQYVDPDELAALRAEYEATQEQHGLPTLSAWLRAIWRAYLKQSRDQRGEENGQ